jgi:hypothetical protein
MCFVWISEQTAIISLYRINWLVCTTDTECVYCAVRTGYLYKTVYTSSSKSQMRLTTIKPSLYFVMSLFLSNSRSHLAKPRRFPAEYNLRSAALSRTLVNQQHTLKQTLHSSSCSPLPSDLPFTPTAHTVSSHLQ